MAGIRHRSSLRQILAGAFCISFSAVWVKLARVDPVASAFYRVFFGFVFLLIICGVRRELHPLNRRHLLWGGCCGALFALDLACWHASIRLIGPGLATILGNFQVFLLTAFGMLFLGERLRLAFFLAVPVAVVGLALLVGGPWHALGAAYQWGIVLGLLTAVWYSGFLLILRKVQVESTNVSFFFNLMLISGSTALFLGIFMTFAGISFVIPDRISWGALIALGLLSQTVGWVLIAGGMPGLRASLTGLVLLFQPLLAFCWDVLLFARPTTTANWMGVAITLLALYLGMRAGEDET
jgi:drug/metabolite transporter (DMT)-like permease